MLRPNNSRTIKIPTLPIYVISPTKIDYVSGKRCPNLNFFFINYHFGAPLLFNTTFQTIKCSSKLIIKGLVFRDIAVYIKGSEALSGNTNKLMFFI